MAYMRGKWYIYEGEDICIHGPEVDASIPTKIIEELAVMIVAEMTSKQLMKVEKRVIKEHSGNFGADPVLKKHGKTTAVEYVKEYAKALKKEKAKGRI